MSEARIRGTVHLIEETKSYGQKGFRKRTVVLEQNNGRFTNYIPVEFTNDGCDRANELKVGDAAEITYRLSGRKWQKDPHSEVKFFLSAEAISFRVVGGKEAPDAYEAEDVNDAFQAAAGDDDEVPF